MKRAALASSFSRAAGILAAGAALACAGPGAAPRLGTEESFDGLLRVQSARASAVWIRPDFDISGCARVRLEGAGIAFRPLRGAAGAARVLPVSDGQKAQLREILGSTFREELARSERFELVEASGPDVLTPSAGLLDVVSYVPPQPTGRGDIFLRSLGEATLVFELRDSASHTTLARAMDRRAIERLGTMTHSNAVGNWSELRRVASGWARLVRARLDDAAGCRHVGE